MFTVRSTDELYNSPMIGNGEVVTMLGPTGYHNGLCPEDEAVNRTIFWAGRRLSDARSMDIRIPRVPPEELIGPTRPLLRLGRFSRTLEIDGKQTTDQDWEQTVNYDQAVLTSVLTHGALREVTESQICLTTNLIVFHTRLENTSSQPLSLTFTMEYEFGDAAGGRPEGFRLHIRRPHPDDLSFGNVEGTRSLDKNIDARPPHLLESLSVQYEVEGHIGEVHIGRSPVGKIQQTDFGGRFIHEIRLEASASAELWFWATVSDRLKYTHFPPNLETVQSYLEEHRRGWANFWSKGMVTFGEPEVEAVYKSAMYTMRCNSSPYSISVAYLSTHWEGRIFHDEFYPFLGMSGSNHLEQAQRVVQNRINTLPTARRRALGWGAYYGWEVTEDGEESAPYGHWTDEMFRLGQISDTGWRYYLYTRNLKDLERSYPVLRGVVEWLIHDTIVQEPDGSVRTRLATDILEAVYPVKNSIFVSCGTIKALLNAARAAELLGIDQEERENWRMLAEGLKKTLPVDRENGRYRYSDNAEAPLSYAHSGMVFPFAFDVTGDLARETVNQAYKAFHERREESGIVHEEQEQAVLSDNWMWEVSGLAYALFYVGRGDDGLETLRRVPLITGPFMTPNEHYRPDGGPYLPWFSTGSGIFTSAIQCMFVQNYEEAGTILAAALPASVQDASFEKLLASHLVSVSGKAQSGKLTSLTAYSDRDQKWSFRIPQGAVDRSKFTQGLSTSGPDGRDLLTVECNLKKGENKLLG